MVTRVGLVLLMVTAWSLAVVAQTDPATAPPVLDPRFYLYGILGTAVGSLFTFVTLVWKTLRDDRRVELQRRWEVEDRRERSETQLQQVESLHKAIAATNDQVNVALDVGQRAHVEVDHVGKSLEQFSQRIQAAKDRDLPGAK